MPLRKPRGVFESNKVLFVPVNEIVPNPSQPRKHFSAEGLQELAESIREHGVLQPLSVRRSNGFYELVSGERRLRSSRLAGLREVPCIVVGVDAMGSSLLSLVENLQRRDLDFIEEAEAILRLIRLYGLSQEEAAQKIGKSQSAVANKLRLLRLSPSILATLRESGLTERHARALLRLETNEEQANVLQHIIKNGLNVAATEEYIDRFLSGAHKPPPGRKSTYVLKDVRLFLNTITRGMNMMRSAGVAAEYGKTETSDAILLTIKIPKQEVAHP